MNNKKWLLVLVFLGACHKEKNIIMLKEPTNRELIDVYSKVGELHNKVLEVVYAGIKLGYIYDHVSYKAALVGYLGEPVGEIRGGGLTPLSGNVLSYYLKLKLLYSSGYDYISIERLMTVYLDGDFHLTTIERKQIIGMTSVLIWSNRYWTMANLQKWYALGAYQQATMGGAKDIVLDDALGAATGAVTGAITGAAGGTVVIPFIGTVTGAVAGGLVGMTVGAATSSVYAAVKMLFKKWIDWYQLPIDPMLNDRKDSIEWFKTHFPDFKLVIDSLKLN